ncbi:MAG: SCP2 sterol-binding domain-containing protein [Flavobacteriales bacterium]|nr:SCP2 sterol-binding domain-containing protein [Flavobacteriales bacterium]
MPQYSGVVHLILSGEGGGMFTVRVAQDQCIVEEGLSGEPTCVVETEAVLYANMETGKIRPEEALLSGKLRISNLGEMLTFSGLFTRWKET